MAVYSEEEPLYALLAAGYKTIKNSNPSQFFFHSAVCKDGPEPGWNNTLAHMTWKVICSVGLYSIFRSKHLEGTSFGKSSQGAWRGLL